VDCVGVAQIPRGNFLRVSPFNWSSLSFHLKEVVLWYPKFFPLQIFHVSTFSHPTPSNKYLFFLQFSFQTYTSSPRFLSKLPTVRGLSLLIGPLTPPLLIFPFLALLFSVPWWTLKESSILLRYLLFFLYVAGHSLEPP